MLPTPSIPHPVPMVQREYASVPALQRNSMWEKEAVLFPNQRWSREASSLETSTLFIQTKLDSNSCSCFGSKTARAFAAISHWSWLEKASLQVLTAALLPPPGLWWIHKWVFCDEFSSCSSILEGLAARCAMGDQGRGLCAWCHCAFPDLLAAGKSLELRSAASTGALLACRERGVERKLRSFKIRWLVLGQLLCCDTHLPAACSESL